MIFVNHVKQGGTPHHPSTSKTHRSYVTEEDAKSMPEIRAPEWQFYPKQKIWVYGYITDG